MPLSRPGKSEVLGRQRDDHERGRECTRKQKTRGWPSGQSSAPGWPRSSFPRLAAFASAGDAASKVARSNTNPPTISGTPQEGSTLKADRGEWNNNPTDYNYYWLRCDKTGGSCANISGAGGSRKYKLTSADVGNTLRFRIKATNGERLDQRDVGPDGGDHRRRRHRTTADRRRRRAERLPGGQRPGPGQPDVAAGQADHRSVPVEAGRRSRPARRRFVLRVHVTSTCTRPRPGGARLRDADAVQPVRRDGEQHRLRRVGDAHLQPARRTSR